MPSNNTRVTAIMTCAIFLSSCAAVPKYQWQSKCDAACLSEIDGPEAWQIDNQDSCSILEAMHTAWSAHGGARDEAKILAVEDKMAFERCHGCAPAESATDSYQPRYSWQNRCAEPCATILGSAQMKKIDGLPSWMSCDVLKDQIKGVTDSVNNPSYSQQKDWFDNTQKALLDRFDAANC